MPTYSGATIQSITSLASIPGADRIEVAKIGNFQTVVPKGTYTPGTPVVFIEADSVLPTDQAWAQEFLKFAPKRVKIIKLRGVWSEGIVASVSIIPPVYTLRPNMDVSEILGVTHYETEVFDNGVITQSLPAGLPKTDEERWEKLPELPDTKAILTLKYDGSSCSVWPTQGEDGKWIFRVFGRTREYPSDSQTMYHTPVHRYGSELITLVQHMRAHFRTDDEFVLRGELFGRGIQSGEHNPHSQIDEKLWALYNIYNMTHHEYVPWERVVPLIELSGVPAVLTLGHERLTPELITRIQDGRYLDYSYEGVVAKFPDGTSTKIINKSYDGGK